MLEFFRKYQRYFFLVITVVVIMSFTFFGTYSTFGGSDDPKDRSVGQRIDGSPLMLSDLRKLARFIGTDREDSAAPNYCNDGVIRYDFIKDHLAELLVIEYFEPLKEGLASRLDRAKRFRSYAHPEAPFLSAKSVWNYVVPELNEEVAALQSEESISPAVFTRLARLYQLQGRLQPEMLRRILIYQHQQYPWLTFDPQLQREDLALFGFHSAADWFGPDFVDLVAQFILNGATAAEKRGYKATLEEAKGDLIHHFQDSVDKLSRGKGSVDLNFHQHLRMLGFDERSAAEVWRNVLLFRKYFRDVGDVAFLDSLPYKDFAEYAKEAAIVDKYEWPIQIATLGDLAQFQFYVKAVCPAHKFPLPTQFLPLDEVEKKCPALVQSTYRAQVAQVSKKEVGLKATLKQVIEWEMDEKNWEILKKEFALPQAAAKEERLKELEKVKSRVDPFVRSHLVDENPSWKEEALAAAPFHEKTWTVAGSQDPMLKEEGMYYRVENLEKMADKHILPFNEAREALAKLVQSEEGPCPKEKNPFAAASREALAALEKNRDDPKWIQTGENPLADQFKLMRKEQAIYRTSKDPWMTEQAFLMLPDLWSPIQISDEGEIFFFYLKEKKSEQAPILDQLMLGKETLAADAKAYVAEKLLETVKNKKAIVIPVQKEDE